MAATNKCLAQSNKSRTGAFDDDLSFVEGVEDLAIEQLIAQARVEALDVAVRSRRPDELRNKPGGGVPPGRRLHRQSSQGRQASPFVWGCFWQRGRRTQTITNGIVVSADILFGNTSTHKDGDMRAGAYGSGDEVWAEEGTATITLALEDILELQKHLPLLKKCNAFYQCVVIRMRLGTLSHKAAT